MMSWEELVAWQDGQAETAREEMLKEGCVLPKVIFLAPGNAGERIAQVGLEVLTVEREHADEPEESMVVVLRETSPEAILSLIHAAAPSPSEIGLLWEMGRAQGWSREETARKAIETMQKQFNCSDIDIHWRALEKFGAKLGAYACLNITETYWRRTKEGEKRPEGPVKDMPGRTETVMLTLETAAHLRMVHLPIVREDPADEGSKILSIDAPQVFNEAEGRATGLIRRAS